MTKKNYIKRGGEYYKRINVEELKKEELIKLVEDVVDDEIDYTFIPSNPIIQPNDSPLTQPYTTGPDTRFTNISLANNKV